MTRDVRLAELLARLIAAAPRDDLLAVVDHCGDGAESVPALAATDAATLERVAVRALDDALAGRDRHDRPAVEIHLEPEVLAVVTRAPSRAGARASETGYLRFSRPRHGAVTTAAAR